MEKALFPAHSTPASLEYSGREQRAEVQHVPWVRLSAREVQAAGLAQCPHTAGPCGESPGERQPSELSGSCQVMRCGLTTWVGGCSTWVPGALTARHRAALTQQDMGQAGCTGVAPGHCEAGSVPHPCVHVSASAPRGCDENALLCPHDPIAKRASWEAGRQTSPTQALFKRPVPYTHPGGLMLGSRDTGT